MPDPTEITGGTQPLLEGHTARPLRYTPVDGDFVIRNGREFFNRPIYGVSTAEMSGGFRVDAGDLPEFSLYLPGHGGNLKLGFVASNGKSKWAASADEVIAKYRPGRMLHEVRDAMLGSGTLHMELVTTGSGAGLMLKVEGHALPAGTRLAWAFGGVSGKKGKRNGDIGCEVEPVAQFFQLRPEECTGNVYAIGSGLNSVPPWATLHSPSADLTFGFPLSSVLGVDEFAAWQRAPRTGPPSAPAAALHILTGSVALGPAPLYLTVQQSVVPANAPLPTQSTAAAFTTRSSQLDALAATLRLDTPDPYLNASAPALAVAAETVWDAHQQCVLHGGVAWRNALAGWRGPYSLDALGHHDRALLQFRHWIARQDVTPIDPAKQVAGEVQGPADPKVHLARKEALLHSNGDLSHNHYDMNLVFFDVLLRHLRWTGDLAFAREMWPAFERQLAWERRLFRRTYMAADGTELPLYEAYAAIWASDNLQYNGGGTAHASAYNLFALRSAATLASLLGHDPTPYAAEAALLQRGMTELLWQPRLGLFAESKDILGPRTAYTNPATWTVYHTLDSEAATRRQAWQMVADQLHRLRPIPVHGPGVPAGNWTMLACSDWLPYIWSLTLLVLAENLHFALALWQAGMPDEAFGLFKGNLLDSMYMGLCPGDFHMSSALDPHRQEAQRDFADPIGIFSRALLEGLFGVHIDLLAGTVHLRPGFPSGWDHASLTHKDFDLTWRRDGMRETCTFTSRLPQQVPVTWTLPARTTSLPVITSTRGGVPCTFDPEAIGRPAIRVELPPAATHTITIVWSGNPPAPSPAPRTLEPGEAVTLPPGFTNSRIDDPQGALADGLAARAGRFVVFADVQQNSAAWTMPIAFTVTGPPAVAAVPALPASARTEPVDLGPILKHQLTTIFTRPYIEPRSPFCSLAIPDQLLGGWANLDGSAQIDDTGLRAAAGTLRTPLNVPFRTPPGTAPNCLFLSHWNGDTPTFQLPLTGHAHGIYLLLTGTTHPQCSRMQHASATVAYTDGTSATLALTNPETWWPIEQDYLLDDYIFVNNAPLPPRLDLRTGRTRILDPITFKGAGRAVPGGAATILHLPLNPAKDLAHLRLEVDLYAVVCALLAATLVRP